MLLPEPDGPIRATNSPGATAIVTPRSASTVVPAELVVLGDVVGLEDRRHSDSTGGLGIAGSELGPRGRGRVASALTLEGGRERQGTRRRSRPAITCPGTTTTTSPTIVSRRPERGRRLEDLEGSVRARDRARAGVLPAVGRAGRLGRGPWRRVRSPRVPDARVEAFVGEPVEPDARRGRPSGAAGSA